MWHAMHVVRVHVHSADVRLTHVDRARPQAHLPVSSPSLSLSLVAREGILSIVFFPFPRREMTTTRKMSSVHLASQQKTSHADETDGAGGEVIIFAVVPFHAGGASLSSPLSLSVPRYLSIYLSLL